MIYIHVYINLFATILKPCVSCKSPRVHTHVVYILLFFEWHEYGFGHIIFFGSDAISTGDKIDW